MRPAAWSPKAPAPARQSAAERKRSGAASEHSAGSYVVGPVYILCQPSAYGLGHLGYDFRILPMEVLFEDASILVQNTECRAFAGRQLEMDDRQRIERQHRVDFRDELIEPSACF